MTVDILWLVFKMKVHDYRCLFFEVDDGGGVGGKALCVSFSSSDTYFLVTGFLSISGFPFVKTLW